MHFQASLAVDQTWPFTTNGATCDDNGGLDNISAISAGATARPQAWTTSQARAWKFRQH
jgi:hypothetical protein